MQFENFTDERTMLHNLGTYGLRPRSGHNTEDAIKDICCEKDECAVDHSTVIKWFKKFRSAYKSLNDPAWSVLAIKESVKLKKKMKKTVRLENRSLNFDGKRIDDQEYQVLCLTNEQRELKLVALELPKGKTDTVGKSITALLDEYNLWN
ncbi:Hypothetical predicted protein [Octopus vulgaris]|uniref:Histone-lysine N-methyltransferase SETMAR-like n=1 Tax=Octopus vulgaris TaxID=6645 RepID=A0AA36FAF8_OCTVU|nr:Hypothetical predicted protein [Octopus vulgaris]